MARRRRTWVGDVPNWMTGVAAVGTVLVTAVFGWLEIRPDPSQARHQARTLRARTPQTLTSTSSPSLPLDGMEMCCAWMAPYPAGPRLVGGCTARRTQ